MRALVTGANGFTGSHLVKTLLNQGDSVVGFVRRSSNLSRLSNCHVSYVYGDVTDRDSLTEAMRDVDVVFHTAAYVELGIVNAAEMQRVNVEGTRAVLEVAKSVSLPKLIYCSTIGIFGDTQGKVINETFQRTQKSFSSAYDRTKYDAQRLIDQAEGLSIVSVLPSGIFGTDDPHFMPVLNAFRNGRLRVWAGGDRVTGIVHVDDLAEAMILAVDRGKPGEHYIISAGDLTTKEMFEIFSQETGIPVPREVPEPLVRLAASVLDPIGRLSGWQPPIDNERVHYVYDRCVRVDATKARQELCWNPRSPEVTLRQIVTASFH